MNKDFEFVYGGIRSTLVPRSQAAWEFFRHDDQLLLEKNVNETGYCFEIEQADRIEKFLTKRGFTV